MFVVDGPPIDRKVTWCRNHPPNLFYTHTEGLTMVTGVDVSKATLVYCTKDGTPRSQTNSAQGIDQLLAACPSGSIIAMEATGRYHRLLANTAYEKGFIVIVLNPKDASAYAKTISPRAKTDNIDARTIAKFASEREHIQYTPVPSVVDALKNLCRTRAGLVRQRVTLTNQASEHQDIAAYLKQAVESIGQSIAQLDMQIVEAAQTLPQYQRLRQIPGFGSLIAAYTCAMLASGTFRRSDSFVAFIGLDTKVKESGKFKGRRRLTKRGDPEARRLLYLAALAASRQPGPLNEMRQHYLDKGFSKTEAAVFVARKLARVAWAIYKKGEIYRPQRVRNQNEPQAAKPAIDPCQPPDLQIDGNTIDTNADTYIGTICHTTTKKGTRMLDSST